YIARGSDWSADVPLRPRSPPQPDPLSYTTLFRSTFYASTMTTAAAGRIYRITCTGTNCGNEDISANFPIGEIMTIAGDPLAPDSDRKSTRLNSSHQIIAYAVYCLKKKMRDASDAV